MVHCNGIHEKNAPAIIFKLDKSIFDSEEEAWEEAIKTFDRLNDPIATKPDYANHIFPKTEPNVYYVSIKKELRIEFKDAKIEAV